MITKSARNPEGVSDKAPKSKVATVILTVPVAKKHSVRFGAASVDEGGPRDPIVRDIYVDRLAAMKAFGIADLDSVTGIKVTIELTE